MNYPIVYVLAHCVCTSSLCMFRNQGSITKVNSLGCPVLHSQFHGITVTDIFFLSKIMLSAAANPSREMLQNLISVSPMFH